ncbi:RNA-binding domain-containing protein, partial [Aureobasidium melanogenum]
MARLRTLVVDTTLIGSRAATPIVVHLSVKLFGCLSRASLYHRSSVILLLRSRTTSVTTFATTSTAISVLTTSTRTTPSLTRSATTVTTGAARAGASTARGNVAIDVARVGTSTAAAVDTIEQTAGRFFDIVEGVASGASGFLDSQVDGLAHGILAIELAAGAFGEVFTGVDDVCNTLRAVVAVVNSGSVKAQPELFSIVAIVARASSRAAGYSWIRMCHCDKGHGSNHEEGRRTCVVQESVWIVALAFSVVSSRSTATIAIRTATSTAASTTGALLYVRTGLN